MHKYGQFGIAFSKSFLAELGASPVIYVPRYGRPALLPYEGYSRRRVASQAVAFDHFGRSSTKSRKAWLTSKAEPRFKRTAEDLRRIMEFLELHVVSNLKFFDHRLSDLDEDNYYMEREWRVSRNVKFSLRDVQRIIIPSEYSRRLRNDLPRFDGEMVFSARPFPA